MTNSKVMLLVLAWLTSAYLLYSNIINIVAFVNLAELKYSAFNLTTLNGILFFNFIASIFSVIGLLLSTFKRAYLQKKTGYQKILLSGVSLYPVAEFIYWAYSGFELARHHIAGFLISIAVSALIASAISTSWEK